MQIDLHYGLTYALSRLAGYDKQSASVIAYSSQYVDDATNSGVIEFSNGALYRRISSAHPARDILSNTSDIENHLVWIPFHFLPGNMGKSSDQEDDHSFREKIVCKPNSYVAKDMVNHCLKLRGEKNFLHRLGITVHVYIDTWSHQEFAGIGHPNNQVKNLDNKLIDCLDTFINKVLNNYPLGHGAALSFPDYPFLEWSYDNASGQHIKRNNPIEFLEAAKWIYSTLCQAYKNETHLKEHSLKQQDLEIIASLIKNEQSEDPEVRLQGWLSKIQMGCFSFGAEEAPLYIPKGKGSWKYSALKTEKVIDSCSDEFTYHRDFLSSDWKYFHDALQEHRYDIIHKILPNYNICSS